MDSEESTLKETWAWRCKVISETKEHAEQLQHLNIFHQEQVCNLWLWFGGLHGPHQEEGWQGQEGEEWGWKEQTGEEQTDTQDKGEQLKEEQPDEQQKSIQGKG